MKFITNKQESNNSNGFYKKTIKKTIYSDFLPYDLYRSLISTKRILSADLEDLTKGFINLNVSDEISNIQNALNNISYYWKLSKRQENLAIQYLQNLGDRKFSIYDLAITASSFISSYISSHRKSKLIKRLKKEVSFLNYCVDKEDSLSSYEIDQINQIVATCKSGLYEKYEIESDGDSMT